MDNAKNQLIEKLQSSTNILVTVSRNPTVDQLAACVGLTLLLNKFGKHATAVFSGEVPSTLEFLQPDETLEKTTDSLRDFIIALDKSKADKLRYKVEDEMVRIFITPFRVSLTDKDLEFSQGDFNVDVVIALGVSRQEDFDAAITAHGRILHDAVVSSISISGGSELGSINWADSAASSLSELIVSLAHELGDNLLDTQVATALLTGIVAETDRFSNEKTTPQTMSISAELMAAGANQQLVATKLDEPLVVHKKALPADENLAEPKRFVSEADTTISEDAKPANDGTLEIDHASIDAALESLNLNPAEDDLVKLSDEDEAPSELPSPVTETHDTTSAAEPKKSSRLILEPPSMGGTLTANSRPEELEPANDILGAQAASEQQGILSRDPEPTKPTGLKPEKTAPQPPKQAPKYEPLLTGFTPPPPSWRAATQDASNQLNDLPPIGAAAKDKTLQEIEVAVHSDHIASIDTARDEVDRALNGQPGPLEPVQSLGSQPLGEPLHQPEAAAPTGSFSDVLNQVIPPAPGTETSLPPPPPVVEKDPNAPPPVPPPIPFNFGSPQ